MGYQRRVHGDTHTFRSLLNKLQPSNYIKMFKLFAVAAGIASASAGYAGLYPAAGLGYGYGLAAPAYAAAPILAANKYAVPAPRVIEEAPIVEKIVEPVEQWGYKIKYKAIHLPKSFQNNQLNFHHQFKLLVEMTSNEHPE